jgi:hypothetical protein
MLTIIWLNYIEVMRMLLHLLKKKKNSLDRYHLILFRYYALFLFSSIQNIEFD